MGFAGSPEKPAFLGANTVAKKNRSGIKVGRIVRFKALDSFLRSNGGVRAVAYQTGGTFAILAKNGNCTPFFNSDVKSLTTLLGSAKFDSIPVR